MTDGIVILGASHAGVQCAAALRETGYQGAVTLVDEGPGLPYQRPPLSKGYMAGSASLESLNLRGEAFYREENIDLRRGVRVDRIAPDVRKVFLSSGVTIAYDFLVIATGGRPRPFLECEHQGNVYILRTLQDAQAIQAALDVVNGPVAIIGGGYVGLELAATLRTCFRRDVHVFESAPRLLMRAASQTLSELVAEKHRESGTVLHLGCGVTDLMYEGDVVTGVATEGGDIFPADLVVKGVGILPNQELASDCGLACDDGILVDNYCKTSDPSIFAIGDCCRFPQSGSGKLIRLECVQNAHDQARVVASVIAGSAQPYTAVPWFWSDQLGMKLQTAGRLEEELICVIRDESEKNKMCFFHFSKNGNLKAVETINHPAVHMLARRLLAGGISPNRNQVEDVGFDLRKLLS